MTESTTSFRDPAGVCCQFGKRILRFVENDKNAEFESFLASSSGRDFAARRQLVTTRRLSEHDIQALRDEPNLARFFGGNGAMAVFEHERIFFPSYPYEWPPEMLWEAGRFTLELARKALADGYCLKDATPYNVLYRSCEPVFIDLPSFEARAPGDPVWRPYAQFVRTFVLPLVVNRHWGLHLSDVFMSRRDGLEPTEVYRLCTLFKRFKSPIFSLVTVPTWLTPVARRSGKKLFREQKFTNTEKATFVVEMHLKQLERAMESVTPLARKDSLWSGYMETNSYNTEAFAAKQRFVESILDEFKPARVLDVGANTGHFSELAARRGAEVVGIDSDAACMGALYRDAREKRLDVLPLVVDLARPSPNIGWRNHECASFLDRAKASFDCVFMLAFIHHLLVTEGIPLREIFQVAHELTTSLFIVEFVSHEDEMFKQLARGREALHASLTQAAFEQECKTRFDIVRLLSLSGTSRSLYALKRRNSAA